MYNQFILLLRIILGFGGGGTSYNLPGYLAGGELEIISVSACSVVSVLFLHRTGQSVTLSFMQIGGGGRSAVQIVDGTDVVTAGGGGGGADCRVDRFCGGGGMSKCIR